MICDMEFNWVVNEFCNFKCVYCYNPRNKNGAFLGHSDTKSIIHRFNGLGFACLIYLTGGEPFFLPNFVTLCSELTKRHCISINTNLSHKEVLDFAQKIDPTRVRSINCSLHIQERERLKLVKDFINKFNFFQKKGFKIFASYVLYPHVLHRFKNDYEFFKKEGIILRPKVFRGLCGKFSIVDAPVFRGIREYFGRAYPKSYTSRQKNIIAAFIDVSQKEGNFDIDHESDRFLGRLGDIFRDALFIDNYPRFTGKLCLAGKSFVRMTPEGDVYRCYDEKLYLGNFFKGGIQLLPSARPCIVKECRCPYIGYTYVLDQEKNDQEKQSLNLAEA